MNRPHTLILAVACLMLASLCPLIANSQPRTVNRTFTVDNQDKIRLDLKFGHIIRVMAWDNSEISFQASIEINGGKLNEALLLEFEQSGGSLVINSDFDQEQIEQGRASDCPDRKENQSTLHISRNNGHTICSNIVYEIKVPREADLTVESISSDIELSGVTGPILAKTISGFVDLSWPAGHGANLSMKTISGEVYSGLDQLTVSNRKEHVPPVGYELKGSIGGGGPLLSLESISGDIYLRKLKE